MKSVLLTPAAVIMVGAAALTAGPASASTDEVLGQRAVFVLTDSPTANAVVAYDRAADGTIRDIYARYGVEHRPPQP